MLPKCQICHKKDADALILREKIICYRNWNCFDWAFFYSLDKKSEDILEDIKREYPDMIIVTSGEYFKVIEPVIDKIGDAEQIHICKNCINRKLFKEAREIIG